MSRPVKQQKKEVPAEKVTELVSNSVQSSGADVFEKDDNIRIADCRMRDEYCRWCRNAVEDEELRAQLLEIEENEEEIADRFSSHLAFGTGGLRGIMGAGTRRMNIYTVRRAAAGVSAYLHNEKSRPSVAIAYDTRLGSELFSRQAALVLAAQNADVWIYPVPMPAPSLSYAVRNLKCDMGICITASHNPADYNGFKVYGGDGCQITEAAARKIAREMEHTDVFALNSMPTLEAAIQMGMIRLIPSQIRDSFLKDISAQRIFCPDRSSLHVVYTPLNGTGIICVEKILSMRGTQLVTLADKQTAPDGNFPTCPRPNPELEEALSEGLKLCRDTQADLLLATDPDCDRVGIAVRHEGGYVLLNGNEVGLLLMDFILKRRTELQRMPENPVVVKTIVTSDMAAGIAREYGVRLINVLTGFKYIGEVIGRLEAQGSEKSFVFGFEESCGYLADSFVRDKDAVSACMHICDMADYYKEKGRTLADVMNDLYEKYGRYKTELLSMEWTGIQGKQRVDRVMGTLRDRPFQEMAGTGTASVTDYLEPDAGQPDRDSLAQLPPSDVLEFNLVNGAKIIVRPSGTEPKLKIYLSACEEFMDRLRVEVRRTIEIIK